VEAKGRNAMRLFSRGMRSLLELSTLFYAKLHVLLFSSDYIRYADDFIFVGALSTAELLRWDCLLSHMSGTSTCGVTGL